MIHRPSSVRSALFLLTLLTALLSAGCSSSGERAQSPATNASNSSNSQATPASAPSATPNQSTSATAKPKLNVNTATDKDLLAAVPNLGNRMVHEFEEYRPYKSIQQFRREIGKYVNAEQVAEYEKHIFVPISPNESDAPTLQQIPGLDATEAQALIAARPYASSEAFLARLAERVSAEELATAKTYLSQP